MEDRFINIFKKSNFHDLNHEEKAFISELCSNEEEFENIKHLYAGMETLADESFRLNSDSVKTQLDQEFKEVHGTEGGFRILKFLFPPITPIYAKPGVQIAFLLVFVGTIYYSINRLSIDKDHAVLYSQNTENQDPKANEDNAELKELNNDNNGEDPTELETLITEIPVLEEASMATEIISNELLLAEMDDNIEEEAFMDEAGMPAPAPTAMAVSGMERPDNNENLFIIEPIGTNLELLDDLFVTF